MNSTDLLALAMGLTTAQVDKMAHALGWPDTHNVHRPRRRVKWANPYRNGWSGVPNDPDWREAADAGLAAMAMDGKWAVWHVTPLGKLAVRLRLMAVRDAREAA